MQFLRSLGQIAKVLVGETILSPPIVVLCHHNEPIPYDLSRGGLLARAQWKRNEFPHSKATDW